ncbi:hypothetical protein [Kushneria aurantia]|uniref:Uncharacterized protein n=1 Tax=Kushneria aurantia TaxID=504092 RepID=A0ABV6G5I6_9GAMM|nr:hypothetical protein [Kushneria aurantia]
MSHLILIRPGPEAFRTPAASTAGARDYRFDIAFTPILKRTLHIRYELLDGEKEGAHRSWYLDDYQCAAITGRDRQAAGEFGAEQIRRWQRSLESLDDVSPDAAAGAVTEARLLPAGAQMQRALERALAFWSFTLYRSLRRDGVALVATPDNSLQMLTRFMESVPEDEITEKSLPTGAPLLYTPLDRQKQHDGQRKLA